MSKMIKKTVMLLVSLVCLIATKQMVFAEQEAEGMLSYIVEPIFSETQVNPNVSYFDLLSRPGNVEEFKMKISNTSNHPIKVNVTPYTARTATSGTVDYMDDNLPLTKNLPVEFSTIVSKKQTVSLKKFEEKVITFEMTLPEKEFDGSIVGSFVFQEEKSSDEKEKDTNKKGNIIIKNVFSTYIAAIVRETDVVTNLEFELGKVGISNNSGSFSLTSEIKNMSPKLFSDYSLEGSVTNKKGEKVADIKNKSFAMAPNSIFNFSSAVDPNKFVTGNYELKMRIYNKNKTEHWDLSKKFSVTRKEREAIIEETYGEVKSDINWLLIILLGSIIVILITILIYLIVKRKNND
ncbi:DUF916 domain-containing protein [Vagococcus zengguangii]|uniref:DUF916 domain-containing protein n=1 Tax=Vagococcus zengguangii TaxID=2571750 RepID=A0A4D7CS79_9ENTE|nr:DUF916 domain-containing protein [Vagococcus zengguangii]QCI85883.1 DUF916 domain-containing protein [Vagococcus zengguangii]TLG81823.1 DUF916 domain-containing protein [Vagococcus zengguangii]